MHRKPVEGDLRVYFAEHRWAAHEILFGRRHGLPSAEYHRELVEDFWDAAPNRVDLAFRGSGKSTTAEEDVALAACGGDFRNVLLIGSSERRASERLASVAYEVANNELLIEVYGEQRGEVWTQSKIVLRNGVCVQAMGRDQDIRGIKHLEWRPDLVVLDDVEDKETVETPEGRRRTMIWLLAELLPACDPGRKVRVLATPMNRESVPMRLITEAKWPSRIIPISYLDGEGLEQSSWPSRFPEAWIEAERRSYRMLGEMEVWDREYMCRAISDETRIFRREDVRVVPRERSWEGVWCMIDPARTVRRTSASTGWAAWSWVRNRLIVWDSGAEMLLPDAIVDLAFRLNGDFSPIEVGVEEDGLNEFLLQPLRHAGLVRRTSLPLRAVRAPRGKIDFIRSLQPFFRAGEVEFAKPLDALVEQLLGFPTGRIDAPNALAYAVLTRPGTSIYEAFDPREHSVPELQEVWRRPVFLACNAKIGLVAAALVQFVEGRIEILADWIVEGAAMEVFDDVAREASMICGRAPTFAAASWHWQQHRNVGLVQAAKAVPMETRRGTEPAVGRAFLAAEFERRGRRGPTIRISENARWTLNALAGGYARPLTVRGFGGEAEDNRYRVLMEGIESWAGLLAVGATEDEDDAAPNYAYDRQGRRYRSAMPGLGVTHAGPGVTHAGPGATHAGMARSGGGKP